MEKLVFCEKFFQFWNFFYDVYFFQGELEGCLVVGYNWDVEVFFKGFNYFEGFLVGVVDKDCIGFVYEVCFGQVVCFVGFKFVDFQVVFYVEIFDVQNFKFVGFQEFFFFWCLFCWCRGL